MIMAWPPGVGRPASAVTRRPSHSGSGGASKRSRTWWGNSISTPQAGRPGRLGVERNRGEAERTGAAGDVREATEP